MRSIAKSVSLLLSVGLVTVAGCGEDEVRKGPETGPPERQTEVQRAALTGCTPGAGQVSVFRGTNRTGDCRNLSIGNYWDASVIGLPDNTIQSVDISPDVGVFVFAGANFTGAMDAISGTRSGIFVSGVSSLRVVPIDDFLFCNSGTRGGQVPGPGKVALFTAINYAGDCVIR